jgi:YfiH family protein
MKRLYPVKNKRSLRENLQHILPMMYDDVMQYKKVVTSRPLAKDILHAMRITGKPLRYAMELGETAFKSVAYKKSFDEIKNTVELMGEIHDADVMIPEIELQVKEMTLFNSTVHVLKEWVSVAGLKSIITDLKTKRKSMYDELCLKLNDWEENNFRAKLIDSMGVNHEQAHAAKKAKPHIITSNLFSSFPNLIHGMSTKIGAVNEPPFFNNLSSKIGDNPENVKTNREAFFGSLGITEEQLAVPHQVHSSNIKVIDKPGFYDNTDGLITQAKNVFLLISTADCFPVLMYDKSKQICAAIHSGWRGTEKNIAGKALEILKDKFSSVAEDIVVYVGPGISTKHFEVGEDVASMFDPKYVEIRDERYYVNILANVLEELKAAGVKSNQIEYSRKCSFAEIDYLHSYRRDKEKSGRMFSVIGMRDSSDLSD